MDTKTRMVLLVEDDETDLEVFLRVWKGYDGAYELKIFRDGSEACLYLQDQPRNERLVLIVLDWRLKTVHGTQVLETLRKCVPVSTIPVVVLDGSDVVARESAMANAVVYKPADYEEHVQAIKDILDFWLRTNLPPIDKRR